MRQVSPLAKNRAWVLTYKKRCSVCGQSVTRKHCPPWSGPNGLQVCYAASWSALFPFKGENTVNTDFPQGVKEYTEVFVIH